MEPQTSSCTEALYLKGFLGAVVKGPGQRTREGQKPVPERGSELATAQATGAPFAGTAEELDDKGELLSVSARRCSSAAFLPAGPSVCPLGVCGCSNLGIRDVLGQEVRGTHVAAGRGRQVTPHPHG